MKIIGTIIGWIIFIFICLFFVLQSAQSFSDFQGAANKQEKWSAVPCKGRLSQCVSVCQRCTILCDSLKMMHYDKRQKDRQYMGTRETLNN